MWKVRFHNLTTIQKFDTNCKFVFPLQAPLCVCMCQCDEGYQTRLKTKKECHHNDNTPGKRNKT